MRGTVRVLYVGIVAWWALEVHCSTQMKFLIKTLYPFYTNVYKCKSSIAVNMGIKFIDNYALINFSR